MKKQRLGTIAGKEKSSQQSSDRHYQWMWNEHKRQLLERYKKAPNVAMRADVTNELVAMATIEVEVEREGW